MPDLEKILDKIENKWDKRQGFIWRLRSKFIYNFIRKTFDKSVPKTIADPKIDEEEEIFSFFARPNMQLGLPGEEYATRVNYDGQLDTAIGKNGGGKFQFYIGNPPEPVKKRIWTLTDGYLPEINYKIERDNVSYYFRAFQYWIEFNNNKIPVNFVQVDIENQSKKSKKISLYCGMLFSEFTHKVVSMKQPKFNKKWCYRFDEINGAYRDNKLIYIPHYGQKPDGFYAKLDSSKKVDYNGEFCGKTLKVKKTTPILIQEFTREIPAQGKISLFFKVPHYPILNTKKDLIYKIMNADVEEYREKFKNFWNEILSKCTYIEVPEDKVTNTSKASLIFNFMCQNYHKDGRIEQHVNRFQYNAFWLRDSSFYSKMYLMFNRADISKRLLRHFLIKQKRSGNFMSQFGQLDGWGQSLWAFGEYIKYTQDREFAEFIFERIMKAMRWFKKKILKDKWGIMPPIFAADNEMISARYTGHNFWAWNGLINAEYIADFLEKNNEKRFIQEVKERFLGNFIPILEKVCKKNNNIVPPGLDTNIGEDWSNLLMIYPQKLLEKTDSKIKKTLLNYREKKMPEGIAMWMIFQHHYITERIAQQHLILGDQELALRDFYSMLSHTGSCHEGFEHNIRPWGNRDYVISIRKLYFKRDYINYPPHGWFAVCYNLLLRNMLIREEDNDLHIFSAISPEWINGPIIVKDAPTYFGKFDVELKNLESEKVQVIIKQKSQLQALNKIILHIPFFIDKHTFSLESNNDYTLNEAKSKLILNPSSEIKLVLSWNIDSHIDISYLSYDNAVKWLKEEYKKRFLMNKGKLN